MTYELAKELKDAGFPHTHSEECYFGLTPDGICKNISLSELIEACGDDFCGLSRIDRREDGKNIFWSAGYDNVALNHLTGSTPEEAVAYLWLALQKHDTR